MVENNITSKTLSILIIIIGHVNIKMSLFMVRKPYIYEWSAKYKYKKHKRMSNVVNPLQNVLQWCYRRLLLLLLFVGEKFAVINSGNINLFIYLLMRGGHSHCYIWTFTFLSLCVFFLLFLFCVDWIWW